MPFPRRSPKTTPDPAVPSILTLFPASHSGSQLKTSTNELVNESLDIGLEIVPIERSNSSCAKTVSPGTEEKEVFAATLASRKRRSKPLPPLPQPAWKSFAKREWYQLPVKRRILILVSVQFGLLSIICLSFLSIKPHLAKRETTESVLLANFSDRASIPEGSFALNLDFARQQSSACLSDNDESASWLCTSRTLLRVHVSTQDTSSTKQFLSIESVRNTNLSTYGEQPFSTSRMELHQVLKSEHAAGGVVYQFRALYDRTVLLAESQLSFTDTTQHATSRESRTPLSPTDQPWLCFFNNTSIQGLIYTSKLTTTNGTAGANNNSTIVPLAPFPFVVQITEQWLANGTRAYCEQQTLADGRLRTTDKPKYFLNTTDISIVLGEPVDTRAERQSDISENACQCQWMVQ